MEFQIISVPNSTSEDGHGDVFITDGQLIKRVQTLEVRENLIDNYLYGDTSVYPISSITHLSLYFKCIRFLWENKPEQQIWSSLIQRSRLNDRESERAAQSGPANPTPRNTYSAPIWENFTPISTSSSRTHPTPVTPTLSGGSFVDWDELGERAARLYDSREVYENGSSEPF